MRSERGFTLTELLIAVAIVGLLAAIAVPHFMNAINRSRQKRSMSDIRTIGLGVEAYAMDHSFYPAFDEGELTGSSNPLIAALEPIFTKTVPRQDGWRMAFIAKSESRFYTIVSRGSDKVAQTGVEAYTSGVITSDMDCDIVYSNGSFVQYPAGIQTN